MFVWLIPKTTLNNQHLSSNIIVTCYSKKSVTYFHTPPDVTYDLIFQYNFKLLKKLHGSNYWLFIILTSRPEIHSLRRKIKNNNEITTPKTRGNPLVFPLPPSALPHSPLLAGGNFKLRRSQLGYSPLPPNLIAVIFYRNPPNSWLLSRSFFRLFCAQIVWSVNFSRVSAGQRRTGPDTGLGGIFVMAGTKADAKAETSGGGGSFSEKGLAEKLNKLNSSAASIQSILVCIG